MKKHNCLSAALLLAVLLMQTTACGGTSDPVETNADTVNTDSAAVTETAEEYTAPNVSYNGETYTFAGFQYEHVWKIMDYTMHPEETTGETINDAIFKANQAVEDTLNIQLEMLPLNSDTRNNPVELTKHIMAGDDAFRFSMMRTVGLSAFLATPDMLVDLNSISTLDLSHSWWDQKSVAEGNLYGKQYAVVGDLCFFSYGAPIVVYFSEQMAQNLDLEDPYQLVRDGKWTWDKMTAMAKAAANDIDGNGTMDRESDHFGYSAERDTMNYSLIAAGVRYTERESDGSISLVLDEYGETITSVVDKYRALYQDRNYTMIASGTQEMFDYLLAGLKADRLLFWCNQLLIALDLRDMDSDFGILPQPKLSEEQSEYYSTTNTWWCEHAIVPTTNPDLDQTGYVLDTMGYYYQQYVKPAFIDTTVYNKTIRNDDSKEMVELIYDTQSYDIGIIFNWGGIVETMIGLGDKDAAGFASQYASVESMVKSAMDKTIEALQE